MRTRLGWLAIDGRSIPQAHGAVYSARTVGSVIRVRPPAEACRRQRPEMAQHERTKGRTMKSRAELCEDKTDEVRAEIPQLQAAMYEDEALTKEEAAEVNAALKRAIDLLDEMVWAADLCVDAMKDVVREAGQ